MLQKYPKKMRLIFTVILLTFSGVVFSQVSDTGTTPIDTSDYLPSFYKGALDYNLMIAASKGYTNEVNKLILNGADIFAETDEGVTALIFAISNNRTKVAEMLIDYGSDPDKMTTSHETPLLIAVKNENAEIAEALIRAGADINVTDNYNATVLHYASVYGYFQITDMLLYYNALIDEKTSDGSTPLLASIWAGHADIADLLIQNGANVEAKDNEGFTPFLMASLNGDTLIMKLLVKKGINIYETNNANNDALALTIIANMPEATRYLLGIGTRWTSNETHTASPYDVASKFRRKVILKMLHDYKVPGKVKYEIDQTDIMASARFSRHDIYYGASLSFKEPYLNAGFILGCDLKPWYTRVLVKQSEHTFYQYMERGSVAYAGIFKDFAITNYAFKANYSLTASLSAGYTFGNEFKGTLNSPPDKFCIIPALSLKWTKKDLSFSLGADYLNTEFYHIGPVWLRAGVSYNIYFDKVRTKAKILKWY